jgi:two-component system, LytTR family, response regulator
MKLRAYLIDDELLAVDRLRRLLAATGRVEVVGWATEPEVAVEDLTRELPDVCFLDIQMPRLDGFELLARLPAQPVTIFTTAHHEYALRAFSVDSVDYLLKPIEPEALERALGKIERFRASGSVAAPADLRSILREISSTLRESEPEYLDRIASKLGDRLWFIDLAQVTHFYAEAKLTYAVSQGKAYCVGFTIADLVKKLNPRKFIRIHRGTVVNFDWISEVHLLPGGMLSVLLKDKSTRLTVARDRASEFRSNVGV